MTVMNVSIPLPGEAAFTGVPGEVGTLEVAYVAQMRPHVIGVQLVALRDGRDTSFVVSTMLDNGGHWVLHREADPDEALRLFKEEIRKDLELP